MLMRNARVMATGMAMVVALGMSLAACGDDDDDGAAAGSGSETDQTPPEDVRVSDAEVATGLQTIDDLVDQAATAVAVADGDEQAATDADDQIEPTWQGVEGTVKANDEDIYITFEDNF